MSARNTELIAALRRATADDRVDDGRDAIRDASRATYPGATDLAVLAYPRSTAEVAACVRAAAAHGARVTVWSRGRNWGYGSRRPPAGVEVGLVLAGLDRIHAIDAALGAVTLEPGVDFAALAAALARAGAALVLPGPGSTAEAGVIAHALQRGIAQGPDGERGAQLADLEVVLADGSIVELGAGGRAAPYCRGGAGPDHGGLFLQSSLGIVTRATIWLAERPRFRQAVEVALAGAGALAPAIEALRGLVRRGLVRAGFTLADRDRVAARAWAQGEAAGAPPAWHVDTAIAGADLDELMAVQASVAAGLAPLGAEVAFARINDPDPFYGAAASSPALAYRGLGALPAGPLDPDRDGAGLLWGNALVPMRGDDAVQVRDLIAAAAPWVAPIGVGFQGASPRALHAIFACAWDRRDAAAEVAAPAAWLAAMSALAAAGYPPYRVPRGYRDLLAAPPADRIARRIARALDPDGRFDA